MNNGKTKRTRARSKKTQVNVARVQILSEIVQKAKGGGGLARVQAQWEKGKFTARERINYIADEGSFQELDLLVTTRCKSFGLDKTEAPGDGVVTGFCRVDGREVAIFAQDFTVLGGSLGRAHAMKICKVMDMAYQNRVPVIGLLDSGGARIQEGVESLDGYAEVFYRNVKYSGVIPQISLILGPCAGGAVYSPALTDFVFMVEGISHMFITGPDVVKAATGEDVTFDSLGGPKVHASKSGVCHFVAKSEPDCFRQLKELLSYLPQHRWEKPHAAPTPDPVDRETPLLETFWGVDPKKAYAVHPVIWQVADEFKFYEVQDHYAKNVTVGFVRLGGEVVGVVANNSGYMAGALDIDASDKAARFVRFLNAFNIPILTLVDVPGFWPSLEQEHGGIIRHGAKLLAAYADATVPKVTVVLRKAYGGAYIAMGSKYLHSDFNLAFPAAELAVMGPKGAAAILYARQISSLRDPADREALRDKLAAEYSSMFATPYQAASSGSVDEVIEPAHARAKIIRAFRFLDFKRRPGSHENRGNTPV
ncbi:MAG: acyl-CoA carboxylase subunit beta [Elusimicrobia bacterium]|nr:acyl-CoA carboxylase subunit beta [Elusimicrobiota bacterium]